MGFSLKQYIEQLSKGIAVLDVRRRVLFGAWCGDEIVRISLGHMTPNAAAHIAKLYREVGELGWSISLLGAARKDSELVKLKESIESVEWTSEVDCDLSGPDGVLPVQVLSCFADIVETCRTGALAGAASAAEHVINAIDFILGEKYGESSSDRVFSDPVTVGAIDRQQAMVRLLSHVQ